MKNQRLNLATIVLIINVAQAPTIHAQSNTESTSGSEQQESTASQRVIEEVFVTATKREKSLRDIPGSIAAVSGEDLEAQAILSINDILEQTPGVTANSSAPGDQRIIMRGISTSASSTSTVPQPVGIFIGDTSLNEPYAASVTPDLSAFDLAAVEVLKGPQGTLFGGSALSGAVRYRLNDPVTDQSALRYFGQSISPDDGSRSIAQGVVVNLPLLDSDDLGMRLTYITRTYPGYTDDIRPEQAAKDVNEGEGDQIRAAFLWQPLDEFQLKFTYLQQDYEADNGLVIADSPNGPRQTGASLLPWPKTHEFELYNLEAQYDWENIRVISSSSKTKKERYSITDTYFALFGTPPEGTPESAAVPFENDQSSSSFQQEIRFQSISGETFEWLVGGFYLRSPIRYYLLLNSQALGDIAATAAEAQQQVFKLASAFGIEDTLGGIQGTDNLPCELSVLCAETNAIAREKALFFDVTWHLWNKLELSGGARYYKTGVDGGFVGQGVGARAVNNGQSPADVTAKIVEEGLNPKLSAIYHFTDDFSIYALANKGFRFGGLQNIPEDKAQNVPGTYKSDFIKNYEIGLRTSWFDKKLQVDITAFHIDYIDALVVLKNAIAINYYDNVGSARSDGYEANLSWLTPIPGVIFNLTGGTVDARTTEEFQAGNKTIAKGKALPGSAEKQYSASIAFFGSPDWLVNVGGLVSYTYVGKTLNDIANDDIVNDYSTYNMSLNFSIPSMRGRPTFSLNALNLTDVTAPVGQIRSSTDESFYGLNLPKTITARISLEFD